MTDASPRLDNGFSFQEWPVSRRVPADESAPMRRIAPRHRSEVEFAPPHSMPSSARASRDAGFLRTRASRKITRGREISVRAGVIRLWVACKTSGSWITSKTRRAVSNDPQPLQTIP